MDKNNVIKVVEELKKDSKKRNFKQSFDLVVNLKNIDIKKAPVDFFLNLHFSKGKKASVCCLIGPELQDEGKNCDQSILVDDFEKFAKDKKTLKDLANKHDFFIAQANIMNKVAASFGKVLGVQGKMPNPKAGCVVPPKTQLKPVHERLQKMIRIKTKNAPMIQCSVGNEDMASEEVADNIITAYNALVHHLPAEKNNIRERLVKLTMGKPSQIDDNGNIIKVEEPIKEVKKAK